MFYRINVSPKAPLKVRYLCWTLASGIFGSEENLLGLLIADDVIKNVSDLTKTLNLRMSLVTRD
jgi:hypothetical protein